MLGFQPYETFQLLIETGGIDRTNTLLIAACDAYARRGKPTAPEMEQFAALASRLFPVAAPSARAKAAATLGRSESLSPELEELVVANIGEDLADFLVGAPRLSEAHDAQDHRSRRCRRAPPPSPAAATSPMSCSPSSSR